MIAKARSESNNPSSSHALTECMEQVYSELDLSEPVWVSKHARDLAKYGRTRFLKSDFLEKVPFDYLEIEYFNS